MKLRSVIFSCLLCLPLSAVADNDNSQSDSGFFDNWGSGISVGVPNYFFDKQDNEVGAGAYFDFYPCDKEYLNFRIGVEGSHIGVDEPGSEQYAEFPGKSTRLTFIRIPISAEYVVPFSDNGRVYLGVGPDLVRTANDLSDFTVGLHLSGRAEYSISSHWRLAVEGGYMWSEVSDDNGPDINLDGAYVIPTVGYQF